MLVKEILSRNLRDRRAVARYGGLTGSPDESGKKRREKGLARGGNTRVRRGMIQLTWRFLDYQKESALANNPEYEIMPSNSTLAAEKCL
jgi:transposase